MKFLLIGNQSSTILLFRSKVIETLVGADYDVSTLTMDYTEDNFKKIRGLGAKPYQYKFSRSGINPFSDLINTVKLSRKIKKIKPDVVLCFFPKPVIFGTFAAKIAGVKNIYNLLEGLGFCYTEHFKKDSLKKRLLKKLQTALYKFSLPMAKKVLFLNADDYEDLIAKNNISLFDFAIIGGIGVDLNVYSYNKPINNKLHFGMVSRLLIDKGVREFVEAAKIVKNRYPYVEFSIAGSIDDNPGGITKEQVCIWQNEGNVNFLGHILDVKEYLTQVSVFVLPSYREGVPRSTQEAMALGRAIITTDVPGCRETIQHGVNGFMIPPWDVEALVEAMVVYIKNPDKVLTMGIESRRIAEEKFNECHAADELVKILSS